MSLLDMNHSNLSFILERRPNPNKLLTQQHTPPNHPTIKHLERFQMMLNVYLCPSLSKPILFCMFGSDDPEPIALPRSYETKKRYPFFFFYNIYRGFFKVHP